MYVIVKLINYFSPLHYMANTYTYVGIISAPAPVARRELKALNRFKAALDYNLVSKTRFKLYNYY